LLKVLEERMQRGEFIIIDATHTREYDFDKYKRLIEDNRYRAYVLDFSDLELEETLHRNNERGIKNSARVSIYCYNTMEEAGIFIKNLELLMGLF
jgi:predicted kinase